MIVIVTGGRDYAARASVYAALDSLSDVSFTLYQGGCCGADALAADWARSRGYPVRAWPADWSTYGRSAGPRRNRQMLHDALLSDGCVVVAFDGGRGTADCVSAARELGIPVMRA